MANVFQKMFLSRTQIREIDQKREIMQLVSSTPIAHHAYVTKSGMVIRRFSAKGPEYNIYAERACDRSRQYEKQISFVCQMSHQKHIEYATHSDVDEFAEKLYMKMSKIWKKNKQK